MSALATQQRQIRESRPAASFPRLQLVPTPAPARGFFGTVAVCAMVFLGTFGAVFFLNTQMVSTAYEIQQVQRQINVESAREATLKDEVVYASTPRGLIQAAENLGLEKATVVLHLDVESGTVISPGQ